MRFSPSSLVGLAKAFRLEEGKCRPEHLDNGREPDYDDNSSERRKSSSSTDEPKRSTGEPKQSTGEPKESTREPEQSTGEPKQALPNLAAHFAVLTNAILSRITDGETSDRMFDEYMRGAKRELIFDLKDTYRELYDFYHDPSLPMPVVLASSPPSNHYLSSRFDVRLDSRRNQIGEALRAFIEEQGFILNSLYYCMPDQFLIDLRLDVATIPTANGRKKMKKKLLTLDSILQSPGL